VKPWEVLGVPEDALEGEVKKAFREASRNGAHPDLGGDPEEFLRLRAAHDALIERLSEPTSGDVAVAPERHASLNDFREVREKQRRRSAWRDHARRHRGFRAAAARGQQEQNEASAIPFTAHVQKLWPSLTPDEQRLWARELRKEDIMNKSVDLGSAAASETSEVDTEATPVGYRSVRGSTGPVRVRVFKNASGALYYTSPLTGIRIDIPG